MVFSTGNGSWETNRPLLTPFTPHQWEGSRAARVCGDRSSASFEAGLDPGFGVRRQALVAQCRVGLRRFEIRVSEPAGHLVKKVELPRNSTAPDAKHEVDAKVQALERRKVPVQPLGNQAADFIAGPHCAVLSLEQRSSAVSPPKPLGLEAGAETAPCSMQYHPQIRRGDVHDLTDLVGLQTVELA